MCEWRMREHAIPIVNRYQLALIYFNNRKQRKQQRRKLSSNCAYLIVYYLDLKKSENENVIDKGYVITLERFAYISIIILVIYMFPHGVL